MQAEALRIPSTIPTSTGKSLKRLGKQLQDGENVRFLSMEWRTVGLQEALSWEGTG